MYEGDDALITCVVYKRQGPLFWKRGDKLLTANNERITSDVRVGVLHDDGRYRLEDSNFILLSMPGR